MKALQIAKTILNKKPDIKSSWEINKLPYYAQMLSLYVYNEPLFDDDILLWAEGPAIKEVQSKFVETQKTLNGVDPVSDLDIKSNLIVDYTLNYFGGYLGSKLQQMTHLSGGAWYRTISMQENLDGKELDNFIEEEEKKFRTNREDSIFYREIVITHDLIKDEIKLSQYNSIREDLDKKAIVNNSYIIDGIDSIINDVKKEFCL